MDSHHNSRSNLLRTDSQEFEYEATSALANFHHVHHSRSNTPRVEQGINAILALQSMAHASAPGSAAAVAAAAASVAYSKSRKDHVTLGQIAEQIHHKAKSEGKLNGNSITDDEDEDGLNDPSVCPPGKEHTGRWTRAEHELFLEALKKYGKEWKKVASMVKTRTVVQTRTHAQKYFQKYAKSAGGFGGNGSSGDEMDISETKKSSSVSQAKRRRSSERDNPLLSSLAKRPNVGEVIYNDVVRAKAVPSTVARAGDSDLDKILPPSYEQFPHPSPVSCGKRKKDELTAAQMLASTGSTASGSGDVFDSMMSMMQTTVPRTSNLMANVKVSGGLDPLKKRAGPPPVGQHGLSIINPETLRHMLPGAQMPVQRNSGCSSGSKTPWEIEMRVLEARIGSTVRGPQAGDALAIATPQDQKAFLNRLRWCLQNGSPEEMEEVLISVSSGESRDRSPTKIAAGAIDAINEAKTASNVAPGVMPSSSSSSMSSASAVFTTMTDTSESLASTGGIIGSSIAAKPQTSSTPSTTDTEPAATMSSSSSAKVEGSDEKEAEPATQKASPSKSVSIHDVTIDMESSKPPADGQGVDIADSTVMDIDAETDAKRRTGDTCSEENKEGDLGSLSGDSDGAEGTEGAQGEDGNMVVNSLDALPMPNLKLSKASIGRILNQIGSKGLTILTEAVGLDPAKVGEDKIIEFVKVLMSYGASAACADSKRNTPLHTAASRGFDTLGRLLLNNGCPANGINLDGETAYHVASKYGHVKFAELLAEFGANCHLRNSEARTALDVAATAEDPKAKREVIRRAMLKAEPRLRTLVLYHEECLDHCPRRPSDWEAPDRLKAIMERVSNRKAFPDYELEVTSHFDKAAVELLQRVHSAEYIAFVHRLSKEMQTLEVTAKNAMVAFTPQVQKSLMSHPLDDLKEADLCDTSFSSGTLRAARRAAGAVAHAVDHVLLGRYRNAFCVIRPPGHHAGYEGLLKGAKSCGFCIFNNVAAAALHALEAHNCERVAVVDLDIHHGNGTEEIVKRYDNPSRLLFFSLHLHDKDDDGSYEFFPGSGEHDDVAKNVINVPLLPLWKKTSSSTPSANDPKPGRESYRMAIQQRLLPSLRAFNPSLVLLSTGFDAMAGDVGNVKVAANTQPQEGMNLTTDDFEWITSEILRVADICSNGKVVSVLEGGYGNYKRSRKPSASQGAKKDEVVDKEDDRKAAQADRLNSSPDGNNVNDIYMNRDILASAAEAHLRRLIDPYAPMPVKEEPCEAKEKERIPGILRPDSRPSSRAGTGTVAKASPKVLTGRKSADGQRSLHPYQSVNAIPPVMAGHVVAASNGNAIISAPVPLPLPRASDSASLAQEPRSIDISSAPSLTQLPGKSIGSGHSAFAEAVNAQQGARTSEASEIATAMYSIASSSANVAASKQPDDRSTGPQNAPKPSANPHLSSSSCESPGIILNRQDVDISSHQRTAVSIDKELISAVVANGSVAASPQTNGHSNSAFSPYNNSSKNGESLHT